MFVRRGSICLLLVAGVAGCGSSSSSASHRSAALASAKAGAELRQRLLGAPKVQSFGVQIDRRTTVQGRSSVTSETSHNDLQANRYENHSVETSADTTQTTDQISYLGGWYLRQAGAKGWIKVVLAASLRQAEVGRQPGVLIAGDISPGAQVVRVGSVRSGGQSGTEYHVQETISQQSATDTSATAASSGENGTVTITVVLDGQGLPLSEQETLRLTGGTNAGATSTTTSTFSGYNSQAAIQFPPASAVSRTINVNSAAQLQQLANLG